jgi:cytoskeletal protein CcmA (bactofilin family)
MMQGQTIVIKGEITSGEDLTVAGKVEGKITIAGRTLMLAPGSCVNGSIAAGTVLAAGDVEGSISATARLEIRETATIAGDLDTPCLVIADGAQVNVVVEMAAGDRRAVA